MKTSSKAAVAALAFVFFATASATGALAGKGGGGGKGGHGGHGGHSHTGKSEHIQFPGKKDCSIRTVTFFVIGQGWVTTQREFCI